MRQFKRNNVSVLYTKDGQKMSCLVDIDKNNQIYNIKTNKGENIRDKRYDYLHNKPFNFEVVSEVMENL